MQAEKTHQQLTKGLRDYFHQSGLARAVVGVSGGIDSALTLKLAVDALGAEKVTAISLPEIGLSAEEHVKDAAEFSESVGATLYSLPINAFLGPFDSTPWPANLTARQNTKARVRMALLYHYANSHNALVLGTSNRSEILLGYGTKYGDFAADIEVIGALYKDEVYALARYLKLPRAFLEKAPTAELYPGQSDEGEIGASYSELDPILRRLPEGKEKLLRESNFDPGLVEKIFERVEKNLHKSTPPPTITHSP